MAKLTPEERRLLTEIEATEYLNVQRRTLSTWRQRGQGPRFIRLQSMIRYRVADLDAYIEEGVRASTSETGSHE
jgi:predicted DNA-binding transcriptional regulator AlpA